MRRPHPAPRRRAPAALLSILLYLAPGLAGAAPPPERTFALRAGKVYTVSGEVIVGGTVLVRDGKIAAVGKDVDVPAGTPTVDLPGHVVIPGLIDAATSLTGQDTDLQRSLAPDVMAADGWDFFADRRTILRGGVTTVHVSPGLPLSALRPTRLVAGRGFVVKVGGSNDDPLSRVLRRTCGIQVTLGELPKRPPSIYEPPIAASPDRPFEVIPVQLPQSRPGEFLALRGLLDEARSFSPAAVASAEDSSLAQGSGSAPAITAPEPEAPATRAGTAWPISMEGAALLPLVSGADHLRVRANRARDILHMLRLAREYGLPMVLEGAREAERLAAELKEARVPVIFAGDLRPGVLERGDTSSETTEGRYRAESLLALHRAGVRIVLHSPTDADVGDLLLQASSAVRIGLEPEAALRAITLGAAEVLGIEGQVGSIEPGKDADLVILGGDPFTRNGRPQAVYIGGELVHDEGPRELPPSAVIIRCGAVWTGKGEVYPGGVVVVDSGKVLYAGPGALIARRFPSNRVIEATREVVVPGLIDGGTSIGSRAESLLPPLAAAAGSSGGSARSGFRLADAVDPSDPALREVLESGITTALISPDPTGPISGQASAWKLSGKGRAEVSIKDYAALVLRSDVRIDDLKKAKEYHGRWKEYEAKPAPRGDEPDRRDDLEPFRPVFEKKVPVVLFTPDAAGAAGLVKTL
ncbi:MAG TPA: amidohydrolase family protein, partial [Planctomycetota bacterium]|nr:amidohydrolase family protein [Planctomycetota bacterium]